MDIFLLRNIADGRANEPTSEKRFDPRSNFELLVVHATLQQLHTMFTVSKKRSGSKASTPLSARAKPVSKGITATVLSGMAIKYHPDKKP